MARRRFPSLKSPEEATAAVPGRTGEELGHNHLRATGPATTGGRVFQTIGDLLVSGFLGKRLKLRLLRPLCERLHPLDKIEIVTSLAPAIGISGLTSIGQYGAVQG